MQQLETFYNRLRMATIPLRRQYAQMKNQEETKGALVLDIFQLTFASTIAPESMIGMLFKFNSNPDLFLK